MSTKSKIVKSGVVAALSAAGMIASATSAFAGTTGHWAGGCYGAVTSSGGHWASGWVTNYGASSCTVTAHQWTNSGNYSISNSVIAYGYSAYAPGNGQSLYYGDGVHNVDVWFVDDGSGARCFEIFYANGSDSGLIC